MIMQDSNTINFKQISKLGEQPNLDYQQLKETNEDLIDMRNNIEFKDICKHSNIPIPGYIDYWDDNSSENYHPISEWLGPTGEAWIGR